MSPIYVLLHKELSPIQLLQIGKNDILKTGEAEVEAAKVQELQKFLQELFYPVTDQGKANLENIESALAQVFLKGVDEAASKISISENIGYTNNSANGLLGVNNHERDSHTQGIYVKTIQGRIQQLEQHINILTQQPRTEQINTIKLEIESLINQMINFLNSALSNMNITNSGYINITKNADLAAQLNIIDELWQKLTYVEKIPFSQNTTGEIFERVIQLGSKGASQIANMTSEELISELSKKTAGSGLASRGGLINTDVIISSQINEKKGPPKLEAKFSVGGTDSHIDITGIFEEKQGKMDVNFTLPSSSGEKLNFRISAKNWKEFNNSRNFGKTSMLSAILRTSGDMNNALAYGYQLGLYRSEAIRQYGKICAVLDILMGFSQENNYADTIVINNRMASKIEVFSVGNILNDIQNNLNNLDQHLSESNPYTGEDVDQHQKLGPQTNKILNSIKAHEITLLASIAKSNLSNSI